jgi:hypothetical protein
MKSRRRKAAALFLGMSRFVRKERIASDSKTIRSGKFCVNAIAPIACQTLSRNAPMFLQSSCFVREGRIVPRIEIGFGATIFR